MIVEIPEKVYDKYSRQIETRWGKYIVDKIYNIDSNSQVIILSKSVSLRFRNVDSALNFYNAVTVYGGEKKLEGNRVRLVSRRRAVLINIEESLYTALKKIAGEKKTTLANLVNTALLKYINNTDPMVYAKTVGWYKENTDVYG